MLNRKLTGSSFPTGLPASHGDARPSLERASVPNPQQHRSTEILETSRLELILHRLGHDFYDIPPASDQIATSVWAELRPQEESPPVISP